MFSGLFYVQAVFHMSKQNQKEIENLRRVLDQDDAVLFIGSGISGWSELPSWPKLISELVAFIEYHGLSAELVRREAERNDLLLAASYGFDLLTKSQIADFVRRACRIGSARPHEIHQRIIALGPRCYITTNYDPLLEESLRLWQPDRFYKIVTNRHVTETADIIQARSVDFIFKPHGDAGDSDSIILTREQYRMLLGERGSVIEALKTLMSSRPIVYLGFGLRDPDFLYVKDLLANTYRGGARDHYAIMADVVEEEKPYWRKNYGIHLISYKTIESPEGTRNHSPLLALLDALIPQSQDEGARGGSTTLHAPPTHVSEESRISPEQVLALARYASHLITTPKVVEEIPLRVSFQAAAKRSQTDKIVYDQYNHFPVNDFLDRGPRLALLIGLPGAGKTYSFKRCASKMAQQLQDECLKDTFDPKSVVIPFYIDLKLYSGNLWEMMGKSLPPGITIDLLAKNVNLKIFIDSFNELPREHIENGTYEKDFSAFLQRLGQTSVIFGSRTDDGLQKLELPTYQLDEIDRGFIENEIEKRQLNIAGRFKHEIASLLQKPFIFQLLINGTIDLSEEPHPRTVYSSYFDKLSQEFAKRFDIKVDLQAFFAPIAYGAIDDGREAISLSLIQEQFKNLLKNNIQNELTETDMVNWLISKVFLIPQSASRLTFFHQSVTEYLAATELARLYTADRSVLGQKLKFTRWDQSLFLALSFLSGEAAKLFITEVMTIDYQLAIRASKYLEAQRDEVVASILQELTKKKIRISDDAHQYAWAIEGHLAVSERHEKLLRTLIAHGNSLGGAAFKLLAQIKGVLVKQELIDHIFLHPDDFNLCQDLGAALSPYIERDDIPIIAQRVSQLPYDGVEDKWHGLTTGIARALNNNALADMRLAFASDNEDGLQMQIFCALLAYAKSDDALRIASDLLLKGVKRSIFPTYLILAHAKDRTALPIDILNETHIDNLLGFVSDEENGEWAIGAIQKICELRPDLVEKVKQCESHANGVLRIALAVCIGSGHNSSIWQGMTELAEMSSEQLSIQPLHLLPQLDNIDWRGHEELLVRLLKKRHQNLADHILESLYVRRDLRQPGETLRLDIGSIHWWLDWLTEKQSTAEGFWLGDRLTSLFSWAISLETQKAFVDEFNRKGSPYRAVLARWVLSKFKQLTTDDFNEDAISFLFADLTKKHQIDTFYGHLLGKTATESFVNDRILPLLPSAQEPLRANLVSVLKQAGKRHGRRYVVEAL